MTDTHTTLELDLHHRYASKERVLPSSVLYCLVLCLSVWGSFVYAAAQSEEREEALKILDQIGQRSFQAVFTYHHHSPQMALLASFEDGKIAIRGRRYRFTLPEQEVISDGQTIWTHLRALNEVQIIDYDAKQAAAMPWTIFTCYRQDYSLSRLSTYQENGCTYDSIVLVARDKEHTLAEVNVTIERTTQHIESVAVIDQNGDLHTFSVTYFSYDPRLDETFFYFDPDEHSGIETVDMR